MKKAFRILLVFILIYSVWLGVGILSYKQHDSTPIQDSIHEVQGVYHIHTTHSDGKKTPGEIAKLASSASVDFIILTDHGNPNFESLAAEGWKEGVLVLAGSELSTSRGHLVALDFGHPENSFITDADKAAYQIKSLNGFSIIAHPYSKVHWTWGDSQYSSGIEIINADSMLKTKIWRWIPFTPSLFIRPEYFLLKILNVPQKNLFKWDALNQSLQFHGYYSTDAHLLYKPLLSFLRLHLLLDKPLSSEFEAAKKQVFNALKQGQFYSAVDAAAQAGGFRFWMSDGESKIIMGGSGNLEDRTTLLVNLPQAISKETHLIFNGQSILQSSDDTIEFRVEKPGVYRVEVFLKERSPLNKRIPWILSNPIFIKEKTS
jgi:hypothetical protein